MDQQPEHTAAALPDLQIDPVGGRWEEHLFEEELFFHHNITAATHAKTYYLPVEYPQLMIQAEKFYELDNALFYVPESIEWTIEDVRCQMDVKLTANADTPLAMNDMGMLVFNPQGDMLIGDRLFPFAQVGHHDLMKQIIDNSLRKVTSPLLEGAIYMNNWPDLAKAQQQGVMVTQMVPLRDPRFFEKNNVAETVQFSAAWMNDVGLRIPMHCLMAPSVRKRTNVPRFKYDSATRKWIDKGKSLVEELMTYPVDYRSGIVSTPPSSDEILFHATKNAAQGRPEFTWARKRLKIEPAGTEAQNVPYPSDVDDFEECFRRQEAPLSLKQWQCQHFRDIKTIQSLIRTERDALWAKQKNYPMRPRWQPFTGNKTMKPLYIRFDVARKGTDILPYWTYFKFRYKFKLKAYKYTPQLERPIFAPGSTTRTRFNPQETNFAGDVLYQECSHLNPYGAEISTAEPQMHIPNTWNKMFIPDFQKMYLSFKKQT